MARDDEDRELDEELDDDSFDGPALESELESTLIDEWCPVCRSIQSHTMNGDKMVCAACKHSHSRDAEVPVTPVIQTLLSSDDMASPENLKEAWIRLTNVDEGDMKAYSIRLKLSDGDVIRHSKFGVGVVVEMTDSTKAEVLFEDGLRRLVCGK